MHHIHSDSNYIESRGDISVVFARLGIQQVRITLNFVIFCAFMTTARIKNRKFCLLSKYALLPSRKEGETKA